MMKSSIGRIHGAGHSGCARRMRIKAGIQRFFAGARGGPIGSAL